MLLRDKLPAGFIVPAQPVEREKPPTGPGWIHEIKHDGYRMIVRRDGERVRLYSRKAIDWTARLSAIANGAGRLKAKSFTLDGEAVVVGPDGLTDFEALRRRGAGDVAVLYAFDLMGGLGSTSAPTRRAPGHEGFPSRRCTTRLVAPSSVSTTIRRSSASTRGGPGQRCPPTRFIGEARPAFSPLQLVEIAGEISTDRGIAWLG
jgi:hypothetical protein